ncbi:MAG: hypothetical protein M3Q68_08405 [Actinomycetota bacterium]|nr:hypothetical protein [Actinomycetota bacterium]
MGARAALALVVLLFVGALTPASAAQPAPTGLPAVQAVLDARVAALGAGNRTAWLATIDPQAPGKFREAQGRLFDGLRSVPLESYRLEARLDDTGDLGVGLAERYGAPVQLPETRQRLRLRGYDATDAVDSLWLTFVQRASGWYVAGDDDLAPLGLDTARGPWDFAPIEVLETEHLLTIFHPAQRERARSVSAIAEEAFDILGPRWDQPWPERIPLILPADTDELELLLQSTIDLDKFLAFVSYGAVRDDGWVATAPRIYLQDENLGGYERPFQVETLVHELVHAAGAPLAGPFVPVWVHEGVADWVATGRSTRERKPSGSDGRLPRDHEFSTGAQSNIIDAYRESRSATSFLAARAGTGAPTSLFRELGSARVAPGNLDHQADAALRRAAGLGFGDLEAGWSKR